MIEGEEALKKIDELELSIIEPGKKSCAVQTVCDTQPNQL